MDFASADKTQHPELATPHQPECVYQKETKPEEETAIPRYDPGSGMDSTAQPRTYTGDREHAEINQGAVAARAIPGGGFSDLGGAHGPAVLGGKPGTLFGTFGPTTSVKDPKF
eukprot:TRINITY_DN806_c1_g1_i1.p1 TRINITY_DN806_c1_g1~~TRINITY_DN806_c1_g1_i1.p1  ORF type:complete len:123 (+),score=27.42 TRINITY_DN806_c1_g1_i1:31-369(+)